jgi:hypothetical protein
MIVRTLFFVVFDVGIGYGGDEAYWARAAGPLGHGVMCAGFNSCTMRIVLGYSPFCAGTSMLGR